MHKDFKIGLAIGVALVVVAGIWLATLPKLSARARALEAASSANPSSQTPAGISSASGSDMSSVVITRDENQVSNIGTPDANNEQRTMNNEPAQKIHVVQRGDTLSSISAKYYGSARQWRKILNANRANLPDPNRLIPGSKLVIPE